MDGQAPPSAPPPPLCPHQGLFSHQEGLRGVSTWGLQQSRSELGIQTGPGASSDGQEFAWSKAEHHCTPFQTHIDVSACTDVLYVDTHMDIDTDIQGHNDRSREIWKETQIHT